MHFLPSDAMFISLTYTSNCDLFTDSSSYNVGFYSAGSLS
jgi:hypothetical protein